MQDKLKEYHTQREIYYPTIDMLVEFPVHYGLIDAYWSADGPFGIFADKEPNLTKTIIGGENLLAVDWVGASKMGLDPMVSRHMQLAVQAFGQPEVHVIGDASPYQPWENVPKQATDIMDTLEESYGFSNLLFAISSSDYVDKIFTPKPMGRLMSLLRPFGFLFGGLAYKRTDIRECDVRLETGLRILFFVLAAFDFGLATLFTFLHPLIPETLIDRTYLEPRFFMMCTGLFLYQYAYIQYMGFRDPYRYATCVNLTVLIRLTFPLLYIAGIVLWGAPFTLLHWMFVASAVGDLAVSLFILYAMRRLHISFFQGDATAVDDSTGPVVLKAVLLTLAIAEFLISWNWLLVIAGDTHNFQKYRIPVQVNGQSRIVWHLVNGGGGAFLVRTHNIPPAGAMHLPVTLRDEPDDFECYPTRQQSQQHYKSWWQEHAPDWAVDRDQPPYHKSFVKVSVASTGLRVQVFTVEDFSEQSVNGPPYPDWMILF